LSASLREKYPEDKLHILATKRNTGSFTYDGIEVGGERAANEIEETLEEFARNGHPIKKLSIVGYSLGGLVSRYAIGLLYHKGWFDRLQAVNFTTFASPHLGVRTPLRGYHNHIWNVLGGRVLSVSGRQLFTIDTFRDTGRPILSVMADPDSIFMKALAQFDTRSLYANIINDRSAVYYTTSISRIDPFINLEAIKINYLEGYGNVLLDPEKPVSLKEPETPAAFSEKITKSVRNTVNQIPLMALLAVIIPLGTTLFLCNAAVQSVKSRQRIRMHEEGKAGFDIAGYRIPLMINNVREEVEGMYENINQGHSQQYLSDDSEEMPKRSSNSDMTQPKESKQPALNFPTLALTPEQFTMIEALDNAGFKKYLVHIHNVRHSHAAIIVRIDKKSFDEGRLVIKHFLDHFKI
jgi:hypothetical protein